MMGNVLVFILISLGSFDLINLTLNNISLKNSKFNNGGKIYG